jgi:hypothetical protein
LVLVVRLDMMDKTVHIQAVYQETIQVSQQLV